ncbi:hypothetical protein KAW64_16265 [bacterium]|jgi:hypothetical protein|nr:hypothetical protein [bacterium]
MRRIEKAALPEPGELRRLICSAADQIHAGGTVVDPDAQGLSGVDIIMTDEDGSAILVDLIFDGVRAVPTRVHEHLDWLAENQRLFLKAYSGDGLVSADAPVLVFVAPEFPSTVVRAVSRISDVRVRLVRAELLLVDGEPGLLLEAIALTQSEPVSAAVTRRVPELGGGGTESSFEGRIESESVRALFTLFRSGVDGLDGRISTGEVEGALHFALDGARLATVAVSPGSFTVSTGDPVVNPIVVSDRVSLERALNAVISFFVREGRVRQASDDGNGNADGGASELSRQEQAELRRIWDDGIPGRAGS